MDIKFHEGDFVENNDGRVGYISAICQCDECCKRGFYELRLSIQMDQRIILPTFL